jgi:four helix bundle protein
MRKKTPNAQRSTSNIEWNRSGPRTRESADEEYNGRRRYDLEDRLLEFAANIVQLVDSLPNTKAGNHIAGQLLRCGTSPLSNHGEVEAAESRKDFLHKLRICLKELRETKRWLRLVGRLKLSQTSDLGACLEETEELIRIFVASARTAERNAK